MKKHILLLICIPLVCSCGAYKRLAYLQDMNTEDVYEVTQNPQTRVMVGDVLGIRVLSSQPILAAPFNIFADVIAKDSLAYSRSTEGQSYKAPQYTVDEKGRINFPVLGPIWAEGLTLNELSTVLVDEIRATGYLKDPVVDVSFSSFDILVLGEVNGPGVVSCPDGDMNIFELLASVGDQTQDAQRDRVWVIRSTGGMRKVYSLNTKSKSIYDSPAFYLQQNDMVYFAPKNTKFDATIQNVFTSIYAPLSILSTIFSGLTYIAVYTR